jgi:hypothetical protein
MIQFGSMTYTVWRIARAAYAVVRVIDDAFMGTFVSHPEMQVFPASKVEPNWLHSLACAVIQNGKITWIPQAVHRT